VTLSGGDEPGGGALDLERADFGDTLVGSLACGRCGTAITSAYYTFDGDVLCQGCRTGAATALETGSPIGRFVAATSLGTVAAALGAAVWLFVTRVTGYEIGLIAIAVGFVVGSGVLIGSRQRGGVPYQLLAVALTYTAICATYLPDILEVVRADGDGNTIAVSALGMVFLMGIAYSVPFLAGFRNAIGILIIGFALWQAWTMNRKRDLGIAGPFEVGDTSTRS